MLWLLWGVTRPPATALRPGRRGSAPERIPAFPKGLVRPDELGGYFCCQRQLTHSRRILALLADDTAIAPGHGPLTTAANERRYNPFLSA